MSSALNSVDSIPSRLRAAREMSGLSQGQAARRLGLHRPTISEIEAGRRRVSADEVRAFAELYSVSASWLLEAKSEVDDARVGLAARELARLAPKDLDRVLMLLRALRRRPAKRLPL